MKKEEYKVESHPSRVVTIDTFHYAYFDAYIHFCLFILFPIKSFMSENVSQLLF